MFASTSWVNPTLHPSVLTAEPGQSDVLGGKHTARLELFSVTLAAHLGGPFLPLHQATHSPTVEKSSLQVSLSSVLRKFFYACFC